MMLGRGVYLAPSLYEAGFMSLARADEEIERTIAIADEVMSQLLFYSREALKIAIN